MAKSDSQLIFEQYFHSITDIVEEARGRKKQFSERVKQIIEDPKTGEKRLESYYEMMQRIRRQQLMQQADTEYEAEKAAEMGEATPTADDETPETPVDEPKSEETPEIEPDEDADIDISAGPTEDVGSFNFNATLTAGDLADRAPSDGMSQDIIRYVEDTPATGNEIVDYLVTKGVNETDAKNKVASLAMLDILKFYFSGEEKPAKPSIIDVSDLDDEGESNDIEEYEDELGDLPEVEDEDLPMTDYSEEELPEDEL